MKIKTANDIYLAKANSLSTEEAERIQSRMSGKLSRRLAKEKLTTLEAIAIQLEFEDDELEEWREEMHKAEEKGKV